MGENSGPRPAKRVKVEEDVVTPTFTRSDVWYDDGNMVLKAGSVVFRIHKGVLIARSTVFRDMFAVASVSDETFEDCPLVHLSDEPSELRHVLKALYGEVSYFKPDVEMQFVAISAFINLGRKYNLVDLQLEAVSRLTHDCPTIFKALEKIQRRGWRIVQRRCIGMDIINLARRHGFTALLPIAFYRTAKYRVAHDILTPLHQNDGSITVLSHDDQVRCLTLRERILKHQASDQYRWLEIEGDECTDTKRCRDIRDAILKNSRTTVLTIDSLSHWGIPWRDPKLCQSCREAAISRYDQYRADFWEKLPGFCDLPAWAELAKADVQG